MSTPHPRKRQRRLIVHSSDDELESPVPVKGRQKPQVQGTYKGNRSLKASRETSTEPAGGNNRNGTLQLPLSSLPTRTSSQNRPPLPERSLNDVLRSPSKASSVHSTRTSPASSPEKKRKSTAKTKKNSNEDNTGQAGKSLRSFFQPATEEERWNRLQLQREKEREKEKERERQMLLELEHDLLEDMIEDDDSLDELLSQPRQNSNKSGTSSFHGHPELDRRKRSPPPGQKGIPTAKPDTKPRSGKRFILHTDSNDTGLSSQSTFASFGSSSAPVQTTGKPWAEQFAPANLDELAVHKRKVADVQNWLNEVFIGRSRRRILVLKGPAGSGKTTTISLLSKALGYDIVEWRNSAGTEYSAQGYASTGTQFDDFLGRGEQYNCLDLDGEATASTPNSSAALQSSRRRIILVEEFPSSLSPGSSGLTAFRSALLRHAAPSLPSSSARMTARSVETLNTPIVIIVSETLLGDGTSFSDSFTVHRLLGPELSNHPGVGIIEFNPIAPTFLTKALDLVLKKEARLSHRKRIPGPAVLKRFAEMGDVRSAISSLEFICLRGGDYEGYSGTLNGRPKRLGKTNPPPTAMEMETLEMVTQREASLGIFHAVGKIMYNKRDEPSSSASTRTGLRGRKPSSKPGGHHDLVSQVSVDDLINETGTDIQTFLSALHENYPPSCHGDLFTESLDDCSEQLSAADILGIGNRRNMQSARGLGSGRIAFQGSGTGIDILRQDEISFQVASRGLLYHLPFPVNRRGPDAHKMFYPSSIKLWRQAEEVDGLVALWMRRIMTASTTLLNSDKAPRRTEGVASWGIRARMPNTPQESGLDSQDVARCMISRNEVILERLPYMKLISKDMSERKEIGKITQVNGLIRRSQEIEEDDIHGYNTHFNSTMGSPRKNRTWQSKPATYSITGLPSVEEEVDKLVLSDDDIEDD
ncbi:cell cycle checkpoint protein RAD17 [Nannizzia gypsea CBS 118893]|uniref:Cell cycle checkpoint protein RAD17 n=1 Tax=Arthroderma gypseum (strain ATCC MYA-4604 / CBS 118893) TaxID=535722 RepID=E4UV89_ARTGP|nr:cell cycle checkpoint protein RAD17 [Nannizzia gypsea CBS 118893]EFR02216.1 cell cycle checkpoint protein RAD17 [Nannizzia gypsea CBS 118893]